MLSALMSLIGFQLIGELLRDALHLPIPGPVIGMFLLTATLVLRGDGNLGKPTAALDDVAQGLITNMGLLFVPAGVGIIAERGLLRQEWLPILGGVLGSTIISIIVTGLVMHRTLRRPSRAGEHAQRPERQP